MIIFVIVVIATWNFIRSLRILSTILILLSFLFVGLGPTIYGMCHYQRDPSRSLVERIANEARTLAK